MMKTTLLILATTLTLTTALAGKKKFKKQSSNNDAEEITTPEVDITLVNGKTRAAKRAAEQALLQPVEDTSSEEIPVGTETKEVFFFIF